MTTTETFTPMQLEVPCLGARVRLAVHCEIERRLFTRHEENPLLEMFCDRLRDGDVVYDVGAHAGYHSLYMASQLRQGEVYAFEPNPYCVRYLQENLQLNPQLRVNCIPAAVAECSGWADLSHGQAYEPSAKLGKADYPTSTMVATISLDDFVQVRPCPTLLKIDVEGAEGLVLEGAAQVLYRPELRSIMLELHPGMLPGGPAEADTIRRRLLDAGFEQTFEQPRRQQLHLFYDRAA